VADRVDHCRIKPPYPDKELASVVEGGSGELDKNADNWPVSARRKGSGPAQIRSRLSIEERLLQLREGILSFSGACPALVRVIRVPDILLKLVERLPCIEL